MEGLIFRILRYVISSIFLALKSATVLISLFIIMFYRLIWFLFMGLANYQYSGVH